jgi:hypothetical protein
MATSFTEIPITNVFKNCYILKEIEQKTTNIIYTFYWSLILKIGLTRLNEGL